MRKLLLLAAVLSVTLGAAALKAGPLEDAKAALDAKQYDKVDTILEKELSGKPSPEALRLSYDAANAGGRVMTAFNRLNALLKATDSKDLELVFRSAEIADQIHDSRTAAVRYLAYAKATGDKTPKLKQALEYVLRSGANYTDEFKKYLATFGPTPDAWTLGTALLGRLIEASDVPKALELAELLIISYPAPESVTAIHAALRTAGDSMAFGKEPKDRYLRSIPVMIKGVPSDFSHLDFVWQQAAAAMNDEAKVKFLTDYLKTAKGPITATILNAVQNARTLLTDQAKLDLGKLYLAAEPIYAQATNRESYSSFIQAIGDNPQIFAIKGSELVTPELAGKLMATFKSKFTEISRLQQAAQWMILQLANNPDARIVFLRANIAALNSGQVADLLVLTKGENLEAVLAEAVKGRTMTDAADLKLGVLNYAQDPKYKNACIAIAREAMTTLPGTFTAPNIKAYFVGCAAVTPEEKLALLQEMIAKAGYSAPMKAVLDEMAKEKPWTDNKAFVALRAGFDKKPAGSDIGMSTLAALSVIPSNAANPSPAVTQAVQKFLDAYKAPLPAGDEKIANINDCYAMQIWSLHRAHVTSNGKALSDWATMWSARLPAGSAWDGIVNSLSATQNWAMLAKLAPQYIALTKGADKGNKDTWSYLAGAGGKDISLSLFAEAYGWMPADSVAGFLFNQRQTFDAKKQLQIDEYTKLLTTPGAKLVRPEVLNQVISQVWNLLNEPNLKVQPALPKALWDNYIAMADAAKKYDPNQEAYIYGIYIKGSLPKEAQAFLTSYLEVIKKRQPLEQIDAISGLYRWQNLPLEEQATTQPDGPKVDVLTPGFRRHTVLKVFCPLLEQVPPEQHAKLTISGNIMMEVSGLLAHPRPELRDPAIAAGKLMLKLTQGGARIEAPGSYWYGLMDMLIKEAIAADNWNEVNRLTNLYAGFMVGDGNWEALLNNWIQPVTKLMEDKKAYEPIFAFTNAMEKLSKPTEQAAKTILMLKSKATTFIADMIAVPSTDPSYPLHQAAAALTLKDEDKAWELTNVPARLKLLPEVWESLDPVYVAWVCDQMRKQKMRKEGLDLCFKVLLREQDMDPTVAAKVLLAKGDIYRDMENYQAARIEYEGLKNNPKYNKNEAGQQAAYRLVDLYLLMPDYTAAESLLDRMSQVDDLQKKAEAYYLLAKMYFKKKEYDTSMEYVRKCKDCVVNHANAELLRGELAPFVRGELERPHMEIGPEVLSSTAVPGRSLEFKLQDQNLAIARAGSAVPVVVRTSKGGDEEHIKLLPSASGKNLFTGQINTTLGKAVKNNLMLELVGPDTISYEIEPEFQKANKTSYPPKELKIGYDAKAPASSGEILSEEEEERRALEDQLNKRRAMESRRFDVARDGRTIRPGSKIYLQVTDFAQDLTDAKDTVKVDLKTASGDALEGFILTETGEHTGIFRGAVPTGVPQPKASASDTEEGKSPGAVISLAGNAVWASQPDGKMPKWIEVDTMTSCDVSAIVIEVPHLDQVKEATLQGLLSDEYEDLVSIPASASEAKGGLHIEVAADQRGSTADDFRKLLKLATTSNLDQDGTVFDRASTPLKGKDGWMTNRVKGSFYLTENKTLELKFLQQPSPNDWQMVFVFIDGQQVLGGTINAQNMRGTGKIDLTKGTHSMEVLVRDHWHDSKINLGYRKDDGTFETLPADWFSIKAHKELAEALKPKATATIQGDVLTAQMLSPKRLRKVRLMFRNFAGTAVSVKQFAIKDSAGNIVVPFKEVAKAEKNSLQIAPGDDITVMYLDEMRLKNDDRHLKASLNSSYFNGHIMLADETIWVNPNNPSEKHTTYLPAKRARAGDQLSVVVTDYDEDTTDERDVVNVSVVTSSGEKVTIPCMETWPDYDSDHQKHSGMFVGQLKFATATGKDTIKVNFGDKITASYVDKENTNPGVPFERSYTVNEAGAAAPDMLIYRTTVNMVEDKSPEALARLKRLNRDIKNAVIYKPLIMARHPDYLSSGAATAPANGEIVASVNAPLLFEVNYPKECLNLGSVLTITAVSDSETKAAQRQGRKADELKVPLYVSGIERLAWIKGYPIQLQTHIRRDENDMLRDGSFSGVIRLQVGVHGDPVDDLVVSGEKEFASLEQRQNEATGFYFRVPTLLVAGNDVVHLIVREHQRDESGKLSEGKVVREEKVRLLCDGRMELLDRTYMVQNEAIHLGDRFYVRMTDIDQDTSDDRDTVQVKVKSSSGSTVTMTLSETLAHSGVFTGILKPEYLNDKSASSQPATSQPVSMLKVNFGDTVTFDYTDKLSVSSREPVTVSKMGKIYFGSDGELAAFTKRFADPEIAVRTRFLMAEALFEMAKEHAKLQDNAKADDEIARGKRILEEAMRDYPETTLAVQGEYLLANLAQELASRADDKAAPSLFTEAISRYSHVISGWPDSEFAPEAQFKKAQCFEKQGSYDAACEEYVKLTYVYPGSARVADATVRLGNYYYKKQSYKIAAKIFFNFQQKNPGHKLAAQALFLSAQCFYKLAPQDQTNYKEAIKLFEKVITDYQEEKDKDVRAEAYYWLGDSYFKQGGQDGFVKAYQSFKKLTWDYPESKWAKIARGRLTEDQFQNMPEDK